MYSSGPSAIVQDAEVLYRELRAVYDPKCMVQYNHRIQVYIKWKHGVSNNRAIIKWF